jgi:molecular chaperone GrpE
MTDEHPLDPAETSPAAADPSDPPEAPDTTESPEMAALRAERAEYHDRLLRKTAEFDNYRKRIERERRQQADRAITDLLLDLLLVADDLDLALTVEADEESAAFRKGVELINMKLHDLLRRHGVKPIEALGADFDPSLHQAVLHEPSPEHREGEVIGELRRGYMIGDRLPRPAMVKVAKA